MFMSQKAFHYVQMYIILNLFIPNTCPKIRLAKVIGKYAAAKQHISELQCILSDFPHMEKNR